eukprot:NODE_478_length_6971_cov_0.483411.p2 type:complete len:476 gc:universal NODE_478_length_6971_cov_0.483411:5239-6666(+)
MFHLFFQTINIFKDKLLEEFEKWETILSLITCTILSILFYNYYEFPIILAIALILGKSFWFLEEYQKDLSKSIKKVYKKVISSINGSFISTLPVATFLLKPQEFEGRLEHIDSLRGFAAVVVAMHHVWVQEGMVSKEYQNQMNEEKSLRWVIKEFGQHAVPFFIVISGFILSRVYWTKSRSKNLKKLMLGRITRIFPLHWFCFAFWIVIKSYYAYHYSEESKNELRYQQIIPCLTLTHIWRLDIDWAEVATVCSPPTWSLSVEWLLNIGFFVAIRIFPIYWSLFFFEVAALFGFYRFKSDVMGNTSLGNANLPFFIGVLYEKLLSKFHFERPCFQILVDILSPTLYFILTSIKLEQDNLAVHLIGLSVIVLSDNSFYIKRVLRVFNFLGQISFAMYLCHFSLIYIYLILVKKEVFPLISNDFESLLFLLLTILISTLLHFKAENPMKRSLDDSLHLVNPLPLTLPISQSPTKKGV